METAKLAAVRANISMLAKEMLACEYLHNRLSNEANKTSADAVVVQENGSRRLRSRHRQQNTAIWRHAAICRLAVYAR